MCIRDSGPADRGVAQHLADLLARRGVVERPGLVGGQLVLAATREESSHPVKLSAREERLCSRIILGRDHVDCG